MKNQSENNRKSVKFITARELFVSSLDFLWENEIWSSLFAHTLSVDRARERKCEKHARIGTHDRQN